MDGSSNQSNELGLVGAHKNVEAYLNMLRSDKPDINVIKALMARKDIRIDMAKESGDTFSSKQMLNSQELMILSAMFKKDDLNTAKDAVLLLADPYFSENFKRAAIKECEKLELREVLVQAESLPISDALKTAARNASDRIIISLGHSGDVASMKSFARREGIGASTLEVNKAAKKTA